MELIFRPAALIGGSVNERHFALTAAQIIEPLALVLVAEFVDLCSEAVPHDLAGVDGPVLLDCNDFFVARLGLLLLLLACLVRRFEWHRLMLH